MSALSFLSKKSWHTGLQQNQEAVWKAEKSALEERRKLDELRKERDREREIQELERLQDEAGGKKGKRIEKVDWMYNAPASGSSSSTNIDKNDLEDYLLGKKRVDKLLKGDESLQHSRGNQQGPIVEQKAIGSDRDVAAKIREDPMFAIKQQEQAAYQALLKDPARLRAMKKAAGMDDDRKETKEERRRRKEEKRMRKGDGSSRDRYEGSSRRGDGERRDRYEDQSGDRRRDDYRQERYYDDRRSARSESRERGRNDYDGDRRNRRRDEREDLSRGSRTDSRRDECYDDRRSQAKRNDYHPRSDYRNDHVRQSPAPPPSRPRPRSRSRSPRRVAPTSSDTDLEAEKQAKLAAMQQNASDLVSSRTEYLAKIQKEDDENARKEEELRQRLQKSKEKGYGDGKGSFLIKQQKDLYGSGLDLNERLKRSKEGLQRLDGD